MSWMMVTKWDRRDTATREDFGLAALQRCRAAKTHSAVSSSRMYWVGADTIAVVDQTDDLAAYWTPGGEGMAAALFALADTARLVSQEQWADAAQGTATYRGAGRIS